MSLKDKYGVSIMVGYVLLVSLAIVMGGLMYIWMKSYVPKEPLDCPDGSSLMIKDYKYDCTNKTLNLTIKNNGRFDIGGYFIHASNDTDLTLPTIDLSARAKNAINYSNSIIFSGSGENTLNTDNETENVFNLTGLGQVYYIQVIPTRWQRQENILRYVSCGKVSTVKEEINCTS